MQNAFVERFNDKMRAECLNVNWFVDLEDAERRIGAWKKDYNEYRPHSSLGRIPPAVFARRAAVCLACRFSSEVYRHGGWYLRGKQDSSPAMSISRVVVRQGVCPR